LATNILVTLRHPHGDLEIPLKDWMEQGPGDRPMLRPVAARFEGSNAALPLSVVPLAYRNNAVSRLMIRAGLIKYPWHPAKPADRSNRR